MKKYKQFIYNFNKQFFDNLNNKTDSIIEALVEYYGEQHRDKITDIVNNVHIISFLPASTELVYLGTIPYNMALEFADTTSKIISILGLPELYTMKGLQIGNILIKQNGKVEIKNPMVSEIYNINNKRIDDLLEVIFGSTRLFNYDYEKINIYNFFNYSKKKQKMFVKSVFNSDTITQEIKDRINNAIEFMNQQRDKTHGYEKYINAAYFYEQYKTYKDNPTLINKVVGASKKIVPEEFEALTDHPSMLLLPSGLYIAVPLFFINDNHFIHELNHTLTVTMLATVDDSFVVEKSGTDGITSYNKNKKEHILHELLNERMAKDITDILHENGTSIFEESSVYDIPMKVPYQIMLPLIEDFYQNNKDLIKKVSITENQRLLYSRIDKDTLDEFNTFINSIFAQVLNGKDEITEQELAEAKSYTEKLQKKPSKEIDIEEYLAYLESNGHTITRLNKPKSLVKTNQNKKNNL